MKFGFDVFGITHLIFLFAWQYIYPMDDWFDKERAFPWYTLPMVVATFLVFPLMALLVVIGLLGVNLRVLVKRDGFIWEKLEALGILLLYLPVWSLPIWGHMKLEYILGGVLVMLFTDAFHKIGHKETVSIRGSWISAFAALVFIPLLVQSFDQLFIISLVVILLLVIPFKIVESKPRTYGWHYYFLFQGVTVWLGIYYMLFKWML